MDIPVTSRIHRILARTEAYANFKDCDKDPKDYPLELENGEAALGVYENIPGKIEESIVITDQALHYCETADYSRKARYQDIIRIDFFKDKDRPLPLRIELKNEQIFFLPFKAGPHDRGVPNACRFIRFINRVVEDSAARKVAALSLQGLREEVDKIIENPSAYSNPHIKRMFLVLSEEGSSFDLAEKMCRAFINSPIEWLASTAIVAVKRIAQTYNKLVSEDVLKKLEEIYRDRQHKQWWIVDRVYDDLGTLMGISKPSFEKEKSNILSRIYRKLRRLRFWL